MNKINFKVEKQKLPPNDRHWPPDGPECAGDGEEKLQKIH